MEREVVDFVCPKCGHDKSYIDRTDFFEGGECVKCGCVSFFHPLKDIPHSIKEPEVKCPYCGSLDTKKITKASKIGNFALWGVLAIGKSTKEWHCNRCDSDF